MTDLTAEQASYMNDVSESINALSADDARHALQFLVGYVGPNPVDIAVTSVTQSTSAVINKVIAAGMRARDAGPADDPFPHLAR